MFACPRFESSAIVKMDLENRAFSAGSRNPEDSDNPRVPSSRGSASATRANRKEHGNFPLAVLMPRCTGTGCATAARRHGRHGIYAIALQKVVGGPRWVSRPTGFQRLRGNYREVHVLSRQNKRNAISTPPYRGRRRLRRDEIFESRERDSYHEYLI